MTLVYAKIIGMFLWGKSHGVGGGGSGVTWKFPNLGPTHRWLAVGAGGCTYVHTLHMYIFVIKSSDLDPHILTNYVGHHFKSKSWIKNSKLFYMYAALLL